MAGPTPLLAATRTLATTLSDATESYTGATDTAVDAVQDLGAGFVRALPSFLIGLVVLALFWLGARLVRRVLRPRLGALRGESVGRVLSSLVFGTIMVVGTLVFLAVAFPAVNVATLLGAGGVVALAAGFAFQDLLENMMSGILLLIRQPFREGDVVEVDGAVGVVEAVTIRETRIRRFDRQQMLVPNGQVYKNAIRIQTHRDQVRSSLMVGVGYGDDLQIAEDVAVAAMSSIDGVDAEPPPEAFYVDFGDSSINLDLRYFHASGQHDLRRVQGEVVKAVKQAFDEHDIDIPFPIRTLDATDDVAAAMRSVAGRGNRRTDDRDTPIGDEA